MSTRADFGYSSAVNDYLDRIAPTKRPDLRNSGTQRWRELLFVHYSVSPDLVRPLIPRELELDTHDGRMWIGIVPFRMEGIRTWFMPSPAGLDFLELNLRTYVHYRGRPGVWFFSLEASSWLAVQGARALWNLPYWYANMSASRAHGRVRYKSSRRAAPASLRVDYSIEDVLGASRPGTLEFFLLERYLLFAQRGTRILEGQVHHSPYLVHRASLQLFEETLSVAARLPPLERMPELVHYSPGVDVEVFGPWNAATP